MCVWRNIKIIPKLSLLPLLICCSDKTGVFPKNLNPSYKMDLFCKKNPFYSLTLLHSERPKLYAILAFLSAIGLNTED